MDISLGILAGGRGHRLGGRDKGLVAIRGAPLIAVAGKTATGKPRETLVCCRRNHWTYLHYADRVLCDRRANQGPVAGVAALAYACSCDWLAVMPCDQLSIPRDWLDILSAEATRLGHGVFAADAGRHTPIFLAKTNDILRVCSDHRSLKRLYDALALSGVELEGAGHDMDDWEDLSRQRAK